MKNPFRRGAGLKNYENARDKKKKNVYDKRPAIEMIGLPKTKPFTKKRERDSIKTLSTNIINKGKIKMRNTIKNFHINLNEKSAAYRQVCLFCAVFVRVAKILVPAIVGSYLIYVYDDRLIIAIGVAGLLFSLLVIVNSAYLAEKSLVVPAKKRK